MATEHDSVAVTFASVRERLEAREELWLAPLATRSRGARRLRDEAPSPVRTAFQRDRDRIIHSKSFRRLKHKTQVFLAPPGDHYRTRLTHTLEVTQIARTIGRALNLNEDLVEAIGVGHDLGHTPFGHAGERALAEVFPGFRHNEQSLRIVDRLEKEGAGLNLSEPVRDGILHHSKPRGGITENVSAMPATLEGQVLKIADGVAYINHDLDDAMRAGIVRTEDVPPAVIEVLGDSHAERIDTLVRDIVDRSNVADAPGSIVMSTSIQTAADLLRSFLFERVYGPINEREETRRAQHVVVALFHYFAEDTGRIHTFDADRPEEATPERLAVDFVASMSDRYAVEVYERIFVPRTIA
ncbi:MAG: deoxyguanosinetriphosphate triphosphohydrolase [Chloroflexia bacterium]|nr:deoxyguanosinetriphosphate triphosphohydrolase [Chloroflexia bacterium]